MGAEELAMTHEAGAYDTLPAGWSAATADGSDVAVGTNAARPLLDRNLPSSSAASTTTSKYDASPASPGKYNLPGKYTPPQPLGDLAAAAKRWAHQRWWVQRVSVLLAAGQAALGLAALLAAVMAATRGAWGGATAAALAALVGWRLLAVEMVQVAPPFGVACREVALPLLAAYPVLSLSLTRGVLLLLLSALVAVAAAPPRVVLLLLCLSAAAATYALWRGFAAAAAFRRLSAALPTRTAALVAFHPSERPQLGATLEQLVLTARDPESKQALAGQAWLARVRCDVLASIDLDRDGQVGAADVAAWFGDIDAPDLTDVELAGALALAKGANEASAAAADMDDLSPVARARNSIFQAFAIPGLRSKVAAKVTLPAKRARADKNSIYVSPGAQPALAESMQLMPRLAENFPSPPLA